MRVLIAKTIWVVVLAGVLLPPPAVEAQAARGAARGVARGTARSVGKTLSSVFRREAARDAATASRALARKRTVFRYTTSAQARQELARGLAPGTHITARAGAGRPLSADAAMRRFGLPTRPQVRETISVPKGTLVRANKVWQGRPGVWELTSPNRLPPSVIRRVIRIP